MSSVINFEVLKNPVNWLIVITVLIFAAFCGYTVWNAAKGQFGAASA